MIERKKRNSFIRPLFIGSNAFLMLFLGVPRNAKVNFSGVRVLETKGKHLWMSKGWGEKKEGYELVSLNHPASVVHDG